MIASKSLVFFGSVSINYNKLQFVQFRFVFVIILILYNGTNPEPFCSCVDPSSIGRIISLFPKFQCIRRLEFQLKYHFTLV